MQHPVSCCAGLQVDGPGHAQAGGGKDGLGGGAGKIVLGQLGICEGFRKRGRICGLLPRHQVWGGAIGSQQRVSRGPGVSRLGGQ